MEVHEFVDEGLGHSSYVIDLGDGTAAIVDPPRFPIDHEALIDRAGLHLAWTIDTHSHADYITGSPGLVARRGVTFIAPAASQLETAHRGVTDDEHVSLAPGVTLTAIATPGHTPDHHAYLLEADGSPVALFTGGSLMVGTVGRTDLGGPELAVPLAHEMFRSLHRLDELPDALAVYPTHGAGSFCSAPGAPERVTTLGRERAGSPLFALCDEDEFVGQLVAGFGTFPTCFGQLPERNRIGPTPIDTLPTLTALDADTVAAHLAAGGVIVDPDQDRADLVRQCLDVGHEHLVGELRGGVSAWTRSGRDLTTIDIVTTIDADATGGVVIDVRQANEYAAGHLPEAHSVELGSIHTAPVPSGGSVTVMCGHGERAMSAASLLESRGIAVRVFDGGPDTWSAATGRALVVSG